MVALFLACSCASRVPIPPPDPPLARTPDAAFRRAAPAPDPLDSPSEPAPIERRTLSNGMLVQVMRTTASPVTSIALVFRGAGADTHPEGAALLTAKLLLEGTRQADGSALGHLSINGQSPEVEVFDDGTVLTLRVLAPLALPALTLLSQIARYPAFDPGAFENARNRQLYAISEASLFGMAHLRDAALEELYGGSVFRSTLGKSEAVAAFTSDDVSRFYAARYRPEQTALIVVGDVDPETIFATADSRFDGWTPTLAPPGDLVRKPLPLATGRHFVALHLDKALAYGLCVAPAPPLDHADSPGFQLAAMLLGGHAVSRAAEALRYHAAQVYAVGARVEQRAGQSHLYVRLASERADFVAATQRLLAEIARLRDQPVTEQELARAKALFNARSLLATSSNADRVESLAVDFLAAHPDLTSEVRLERVRRATSADVQAAAARWLRADQLQLAALLDRAYFNRELGDFGEVRWLHFRARKAGAGAGPESENLD
jgi:zinc protease